MAMLQGEMRALSDTIDFEIAPKEGSPSGYVLTISKSDAQFHEEKARISLSGVAQRKRWVGYVRRQRNNSSHFKLYSKEVVLTDRPLEIDLGLLKAYEFSGYEIEFRHEIQVEMLESGLRCAAPVELTLPNKNRFGPGSIINPIDEFHLIRNYAVLPTTEKIKIGLIQLGLLVTSILMFWGSVQAIDTRGEDTAGLILFLLAFVPIAGMVWIFFKGLGNYASVKRKNPFQLIRKGESYLLRSLLEGQVDVNLSGATIKVVCCNMERFKYLEYNPNGPDRWKNDYKPFNGHLLYEGKIKDVPAGADIQSYLPYDNVDFSLMFDKLYPQLMVDGYGVTVYWEIQIIHPDLRDLEIPVFGLRKDYVYEDFLDVEPVPEAV